MNKGKSLWERSTDGITKLWWCSPRPPLTTINSDKVRVDSSVDKAMDKSSKLSMCCKIPCVRDKGILVDNVKYYLTKT